MRKVITGAFVSLDGVMQAPGGPEEDPTRGFKFGGWVVPYADQVLARRLTICSASRSTCARAQDLRDLRGALALC